MLASYSAQLWGLASELQATDTYNRMSLAKVLTKAKALLDVLEPTLEEQLPEEM